MNSRLISPFVDGWRLAPAEVLSMFSNDLRHAFRQLLRDPLFTATAVLTLTLGVGANVSVFAVVNAVLLRPLPYADADRLVVVRHRDTRTGITKDFIAIGDYVDLHARQQAFESLAAYGNGPNVVYGDAEPYEVAALQATPDLLRTLRLQPLAGRSIEPDDVREKAAPVVMLGYELWQTRFGGDPSIVGRSIRVGLAAVPRQVVGIAPRGFRFPAGAATDLILPMTTPPAAPATRKSGWTFAAARLNPGVTLEQAGAHLSALSHQMEQEHRDQNQGSEYYAVPLRDAMVGETRTALVLLLAAVGLVLLIACANVANLLAARSLGRKQEMSIRVALGAGRRHIALQLAAESLALACVACLTAVLFSYWATPALVSLVPASVDLASVGDISLDGTVLLFAAGISLGATLAFGAFSAVALRRDSTVEHLVAPGRVTARPGVRRATSALVAAEIALAIVLLAGAGLVLRSFANLMAVNPGFTIEHVLRIDAAAPLDRYRDPGARAALQQRLFEAIRRVPGVEDAGSGAVTPLTGNNWTVPFERADQPVPSGQRPPDVGWQSADGGYFRALRIPLRAGRLFSAEDTPRSAPVVIVSEAIQHRFFDGESAVGRRVKLGDQTAEIVGVVGDIRRAALTDAPTADMYFSQEQAAPPGTTYFIRTSGDPLAIAPAVRAALREVEPSILIRQVRSMEDVTRESVQITRLALWLLGLFAATAVALAGVGIYGVMSYTVRQRMREIGTRIALGATPGGILRLVLGHAARIAAIGTAAGVGIALVGGRALRSLLFSTSPADPQILATAAGTLFIIAMVACYVPARRATRVDPVKTLTA